MRWSHVAVCALLAGSLVACSGDDESGTPAQRTCRQVYDREDDQTMDEALEEWRTIWDDAKDAPANLRVPVETILTAHEQYMEGRRYDEGSLRLAVNQVLLRCGDVDV